MEEKRTIKDFQEAFKKLFEEMEQELGCECSGMRISVTVRTAHDAPGIGMIRDQMRYRELKCEMTFGDYNGFSFV